MKLYNLTNIPDSVLEPVLARAAIHVGVRSAKVIVRVVQGRSVYGRLHGLATPAVAVYRWWLTNSHTKKQAASRSMSSIDTDGGYITLTLPRKFDDWTSWTALGLAEAIYKMAAHEWQHIKEYQAGMNLAKDHNFRWANRPCEKRAMSAACRAEKRRTSITEDAILNLAIWFEEHGYK